MAADQNTAPAVAQSATPSATVSPHVIRLLEAIAVVEVVRDLLLAEEERGSKRIALEGVIRALYEVSEDLDAESVAS